MDRYDVVIIGSGFASSILARILLRSKLSVAMLEKSRHPRFALGESTTPLGNYALERLAQRYDMEDLYQLSSHGRWMSSLPHLRRGLKRGFTFFRHEPGRPFENSESNEGRLLVAASPEDYLADTHWLRADVDHHLAERARDEGVEVLEETEVEAVDRAGDGLCLRVRHADGETRWLEAPVVVDGSGGGRVLARSLGLTTAPAMGLETSLLYGHFRDMPTFQEVAVRRGARFQEGPYADDVAAVHHLLEEGWMYALTFDHGVVSAGIVLRGEAGRLEPGEEPSAAFRRVLARYPTLAEQFAEAKPEQPITHVTRLPHRLRHAVGRGWFLLPHTFAFLGPLFSTGIAWSLLAVERLGQLLSGQYGTPKTYGRLLEREAGQMASLVEAAHLAMPNFPLFRSICALYFAAVSHEELYQRLLDNDSDRPRAWRGFLGVDELRLRRLFRDVLGNLRRSRATPDAGTSEALIARIEQEIRPYDMIGLDLEERRNLHPVDLDLLLDRCHLLGLSRRELSGRLHRLRGE